MAEMMDLSELFETYEIEQDKFLTSDTLLKLRKAYVDLIVTLQKDDDSLSDRKKAAKIDLLNQHKEGKIEGMFAIRQSIQDLVNEMGSDILPRLVEEVQSMKQDLMELRDFHIETVARANKKETVTESAEIEIRKTEATNLRDSIIFLWGFLKSPTDLEGFPTKKSDKTKKVSPSLPNIPPVSSNGAVRGRNAKVRLMKFTVDGNEIPKGTMVYDMLTVHVTDFVNGGKIWKPSDLIEVVEENYGKGSYCPDGIDNKWTVTINGKEISGWLDKE